MLQIPADQTRKPYDRCGLEQGAALKCADSGGDLHCVHTLMCHNELESYQDF